MKIRFNKKMFLGFALALMLFGSTVASAQSINQPRQLTCQGALSFGPTAPVHMGAVGY